MKMDIVTEEEKYRKEKYVARNKGDIGENARLEEELYRTQWKFRWGRSPGDPLLTSMDKDGTPIRGKLDRKVEKE